MKKILVAAISIVLLASCTKDDVESHSIQSVKEQSIRLQVLCFCGLHTPLIRQP